jgi:hypothetical protein
LRKRAASSVRCLSKGSICKLRHFCTAAIPLLIFREWVKGAVNEKVNPAVCAIVNQGIWTQDAPPRATFRTDGNRHRSGGLSIRAGTQPGTSSLRRPQSPPALGSFLCNTVAGIGHRPIAVRAL